MSNKINPAKEKLIVNYIKKIDTAIDNYNSAIETDNEIFDLLIEIINVFEIKDANTTKALLIMFLANNEIEYKEKHTEKNIKEKRF